MPDRLEPLCGTVLLQDREFRFMLSVLWLRLRFIRRIECERVVGVREQRGDLAQFRERYSGFAAPQLVEAVEVRFECRALIPRTERLIEVGVQPSDSHLAEDVR